MIIISSVSSSLVFRALHFLGFASVFGLGSAACLDGHGLHFSSLCKPLANERDIFSLVMKVTCIFLVLIMSSVAEEKGHARGIN